MYCSREIASKVFLLSKQSLRPFGCNKFEHGAFF